ncbi:hypothetical protein GCM10010411_75060 [Actinomadura fulvescens]|uniref:Uncharacterized protein n=1 Tax=Actinomadura fulvescens TaxID=46160 RepID=A0ABN3QI74_9ACTN
MADSGWSGKRPADMSDDERAALAAELTSELADDDPMVEIVQALLAQCGDRDHRAAGHRPTS